MLSLVRCILSIPILQRNNMSKCNQTACSVLGEQPKDTKSKVELNESDPDVTTNIRLHLDLPEDSAMKLWENMEKLGYDRHSPPAKLYTFLTARTDSSRSKLSPLAKRVSSSTGTVRMGSGTLNIT